MRGGKREWVGAGGLREEVPAMEFLVDRLIPANVVAMLVAEGGAGKTYLTLHLAESGGRGGDFFGFTTKPTRVAYIGLEDPADILRRRIYHIYQDRRAELVLRKDPKRLGRYDANLYQNLTVASLVGEQVHLIGMNGGGVVQSPTVDWLIAKLKDADVRFLVLDPMSRLHGLDENANAIGTPMVNANE